MLNTLIILVRRLLRFLLLRYLLLLLLREVQELQELLAGGFVPVVEVSVPILGAALRSCRLGMMMS